MKKANAEGKTASELIMGWIRSYMPEELQETPDLAKMQADLENLKQQVYFSSHSLLLSCRLIYISFA
ncbi:hypothetical protein [uncultured Nostoc sp.]|uniref:hypothetical protein n=1 Tax=uncultured Nostoc sp. TaxID=340711 RepID=UPI0035C97EBC